MSPLPLVLAAVGGGLIVLASRRARGLGDGLGVLALVLVAVIAAWLPDSATGATLAGEPIAIGGYVRLFVVLAAICGLALTLLKIVAGGGDSAAGGGGSAAGGGDSAAESGVGPAPGFLFFAGGAALALSVVAPAIALFTATGAGLAGLAALSGRAPAAVDAAGAPARRLGLDVLRAAIALFAAVLAVDLLIGPADVIAGQPFGVGLAALALAGGAALRLGIVPGHAHAARIAEGGPRWGVPILSVWGPALFALVGLAAFESAVLPLDLPLSIEHGAIAGLAILTIVVGGLAALVQDDVDHVVAYSILQDAGLVMLAFASGGTSAWVFAGTWLLAFAVGKTTLLAWAATLGRTFGGRSLRALGGWARRAPLLAVALVFLGVATIGLPGLAAFEARLGLLRGALAEPLSSMVLVASLGSIAVHARLLAIGLGRPASLVEAAPDERLRWPKADLRRRVSATAREAVDANRMPLSAALVLALALLAAAVGAGAFGLREAAGARPPAPLPGPEPTPVVTPTFRPVPTESPSPSR